jgi:Helix-loop-helix DNA-binding domain
MTAMVGGDDDEAIGSVDDTKKSERKRKRERQRRSDLTNALDELSVLVSQIDPEEQSDTVVQKKRRRKSGEAEAASGNNELDSTNMTRLDLVGRTTMVLRRLQRENAELKRRLEEQQSRSSGDDKVSLLGVSTLTRQSRWMWFGVFVARLSLHC